MAKLNGVSTVDMVAGKIEKVAYEGAEYVRVEGDPNIGDLIVPDDAWEDATGGEFYECVSLDFEDDARIIDDVGDESAHSRDHYEVFHKVSAPSLESRVEALESDVAALKEGGKEAEEATATKFKAGDKIKNKVGGRILTIKSRMPMHDDGGFGKAWNFEEYPDHKWLGESQFDAYVEKVLEVGDYAKVIKKGTGDSDFVIDEIVVVTRSRVDRRHRVKHLHNNVAWFMTEGEEIVRATDAEVAEAKAALEPKFAVGDYAKVVGDTEFHDISKGSTVKISKVLEHATHNIRIDLLDGSDYDWTKSSSLEKVSAEEVAKLEADAKAKAEWAEIGREENKLRKGDVIHGQSCHSGYITGEVEDIAEGTLLGIRLFDGNYRSMNYGEATLVTTVESRFDRQ